MIKILNPIFVLFFSLLHCHYYLNIQTSLLPKPQWNNPSRMLSKLKNRKQNKISGMLP